MAIGEGHDVEKRKDGGSREEYVGIAALAYKGFFKINCIVSGVDWVFLGWVFGGDEAERAGSVFAVGGFGVSSFRH